MSAEISKTRPLIARPGAHFACSGTNLCCTDLHALGPLTRSEVKAVRRLKTLGTEYNAEIEDHVMRPENGRCVFLSERGCEIHATQGPEHKPIGCRRFPYGLIATPFGGRVTTEHRCPCRTLGDRPELSLVDAEASLKDRAGRLESDSDAPDRIEMVDKKRVPFSVYAAIEAKLIARLNQGERAEDVLGALPFPKLTHGTWAHVAADHFEMMDGTAGGLVVAYFGDAVLELANGHVPPPRERPWAPAFERAHAGGTQKNDPERIYNDWIADEIWMFRWLPWGPFDVARAELATRLAVARHIQKRLQKLGVPKTQAAAEAVMCCELAAAGTEWPEAVAAIVTSPSPALPVELPVQPTKPRKPVRAR